MARLARPDAQSATEDRYAGRRLGEVVSPLLAAIGLVVVGWLTVSLLTGDLPVPGTPGGNAGRPGRTPAPSDVVIVDPRSNVPGSIVYVKGGNVWVQSGESARQVTRSGTASQPSWSPDGEWIWYVETAQENGFFPSRGVNRRYVMFVPTLMRTRADATSEPEAVANGRIERGRYRWFFWIRQPVVSPDGRTVAVISDGPDPTESNMVLQLLDLETGRFRRANVPEAAPLGHQDPAWRPDGRLLLVVRNAAEGANARGVPTIMRWDPRTRRSAALSGAGYTAPAWSRDQAWIAATRTTSLGTDVVILDASTGAEVFRVTGDAHSFAPVWSPVGDAVAFLHEEGGIVDLRLARLEGTAPAWRVAETINLTEVSGLDARSRPGWFIPASELPALPTAAPSGSVPASPGAAPASAGPSEGGSSPAP